MDLEKLHSELGKAIIQAAILGTIQLPTGGRIGDLVRRIAEEMNKPKVEETTTEK